MSFIYLFVKKSVFFLSLRNFYISLHVNIRTTSEQIAGDSFVSTKKAAKIIGCARNTILDWCHSGKIKFRTERWGPTRLLYKVDMNSIFEFIEMKKKETSI